jgi:hypothetical protein
LAVFGGYILFKIHRTAQVRAVQAKEEAERQATLEAWNRQRQEVAAHASAARTRETFCLEVKGLGLSLEKCRNVQVWERMEENHHQASILPADPKAYPWSIEDKYAFFEKRCQDALGQAADWFSENWEMPIFLAGPELRNTEFLGHLDVPMRNALLQKNNGGDRYPMIGDLTGARMERGMDLHLFTAMQIYHSPTPEQVLPDVFAFFDAHPEVPAVMVFALDSLSARSLLRDFDRDGDTVVEGYRQPGELTESMTGLVLARTDRVDAMRPFAPPEPPAKHHFPWTQAQPPPPAPAAFRPSEFLPRPWDKWQLVQFDRLPVLGRIHRPRVVSYLRPDGKPMKPGERQAAFAAGWKAALDALPEGQAPARVLYDHGSARHCARLVPLSLALHHLGPELDLNADCVNLDRCLGDLGADASFVNAALGVYASHRRDDVTACVSLRQEHGALILMVSPPTAGERKVPHPGGRDPLDVQSTWYGNPYWWLPADQHPKGMRVHSWNRQEDY